MEPADSANSVRVRSGEARDPRGGRFPRVCRQTKENAGLAQSGLDNSGRGHIIKSMNSTATAAATAMRKEIYDRKSYDPTRSIGGLLGRVKLAMVAAMDTELAPLDVTAAQFVILKAIATGEADCASGLCKDISYDPSAMTRMLDRLERRGLVRRVVRPNDRRACSLELTAEGKAIYPKLQASGMKVLNRFLRGFTHKEARQLETFLQRMLESG
jgi:DNA-binding MarR family transcriptional regulator